MCDQAEKELLDAELDFHKKMSSGEDTTDLKRKLGQLQVEVMTSPQRHTKWIDQLPVRSLNRLKSDVDVGIRGNQETSHRNIVVT